MSSTNINLVVHNYYLAITAKFPRARYYCGYDSMFLFVPASMMPLWLADRIIANIEKQEVEEYFTPSDVVFQVVPARYGHLLKK